MYYPPLKSILAFTAALLVAFPTLAGSSQLPMDKGDAWKLVESYGFPLWVAANYVIDAPALSHRHIYLLIDSHDFTEKNIRTVFTSLAAEFASPPNLFIYAYSDRSVLKQKLDKARSGILCDGIFENSPQGRRASRNMYMGREPKLSGYYRGEYFRFPDGREQIEYSPDPNREHVIKIDLKNPTLTYTGDPAKDLISAARIGDLERLKALLEQGADVNATGGYGNTALSAASSQGQVGAVEVLLDKGATVDLKDNYGHTALMLAAMDGGDEIVRLLLGKGADVNARTGATGERLDDTALMLAALHGHAPVVEHLLDGGAQVEERNRFGETALMQAALAGFADVVSLLGTHGADANASDADGETALMMARDEPAAVEALLGLGADYKLRDKRGMTALMTAIWQYQSAKVKALISAGAGLESAEAAKAYIDTPAAPNEPYPGFRKEEGYRILTEIYLKLGLNKQAVNTSRQALEALGDKAHLRARLGSTYLAVGDRDSALKQYVILKERLAAAADENTKRLYRGWAEALFEQINK